MATINRGDTGYLMLNYTLNGDPLEEGAYQEIELQINTQGATRSIKKLLTAGDIQWGTLTYVEESIEKTFTGYFAYLTQEETFLLKEGNTDVQVRIMLNDEVGSSAISPIKLGETLSKKVLS